MSATLHIATGVKKYLPICLPAQSSIRASTQSTAYDFFDLALHWHTTRMLSHYTYAACTMLYILEESHTCAS